MIWQKECVSKVPVWVQFHGIPLEFWTLEGLSYIASAIGVPLYADAVKESCSRLSFARICVELDASKPLIHEFLLHTNSGDTVVSPKYTTIKVVYQWKPKLCSSCKVFGHTLTTCPEQQVVTSQSHDQNNKSMLGKAATNAVGQSWRIAKKRCKSVPLPDADPDEPVLLLEGGPSIESTETTQADALAGLSPPMLQASEILEGTENTSAEISLNKNFDPSVTHNILAIEVKAVSKPTQATDGASAEESSPTRTSLADQVVLAVQKASTIDSPSLVFISKLASKVRLIDGALPPQQDKSKCFPSKPSGSSTQTSTSKSGSASNGLLAGPSKSSK